jgi:hypothetical protein
MTRMTSDAQRGRKDYRNNIKTLFRDKWPAQPQAERPVARVSQQFTAVCAP